MQGYENMEITQLVSELNKLNDEDFRLIIKSLDVAQLREVMPLIAIEKGLRVVQELNLRKETKSLEVTNNIPVQLQLALTSDEIAPAPNLLLRSNLFSASKTHGAHDDPVRDFVITTYGEKAEVSLTAFRQFNQLDLDLLLELIKFQQEQNIPLVKVSLYEIVKNTKGSGEGKAQYTQIKEQLELLQNASIKIKYGRYSFVGGILSNVYFDDVEHVYVMQFNQHLQPLFSNTNWTGIDTNIRKQLKTNLAKWLHGFYSTHLNSHLPIKLETLYKLSGATDKDMARWVRVRVANALENLQEVFAKNGKRFTYQIEDGNLYVNKSQTLSQNRSIKNKIVAGSRKKKPVQPQLKLS